jgi:hypothetical protein
MDVLVSLILLIVLVLVLTVLVILLIVLIYVYKVGKVVQKLASAPVVATQIVSPVQIVPTVQAKTVIPPLPPKGGPPKKPVVDTTPTTIKAVRADVEDDAPNDLVRHLRQSKYFKKKAMEAQI